MLDQPSFEREINAYLVNVDGVLKGKGLLNDKGSAKLNSIQQEVDMTLDKMRAMQRERRLSRVSVGVMANASINKVKVLADQILDGGKVPLGSVFGNVNNDSIFTVPAWKEAFSKVSIEVSNFANKYGILISNMDQVSRTKIDQALATIIDNAQVCFDKNPSASGAAQYMNASMQSLKVLESAAQKQQSISAAGMLEVIVSEKNQERVKELANMKLIESKLTPGQISVVNDANRRIMEKLDDILKDQTSYDAAIRNKKLKLVDSDLEIMRQTLQNQEFASSLGKSLPPPRTGGSKLGYLNKYRMIQDFRDAPASNLGGGLGISFQQLEYDTDPSPDEVLAVVKHNAAIIKAQGGVSSQNRFDFIRQVNSLTKGSFGGDTIALKEAKKHYLLLASSQLAGMTAQEIRDKHPKGTKESHIQRMHQHMERGMEFGPAHDQAKKDGFPAGNLAGVFTYDKPQESLPNWARVIGTVVLYVGIPATAIYFVGSRINKRKNPAAMVAQLMEEE